MTNPLLADNDLPPFDEIKAEHVVPAIDQIITANLQAIDELVNQQLKPTWQSLIEPLEEMQDRLSKAWSPVSHLNSVMNSPALREAYHACLAKLSHYATQVGQNQALYQAYIALKESPTFLTLTSGQQKVITNAIRDFKLSGVALTPAAREQFATLSQTLSQLQSRFQDNVMDATDHWHLDVTMQEELAGLPQQTLQAAKEKSAKENMNGWRLTLDFPCYHAVLTYAEDRNLRHKIHEAYATRASDQGPHDKKWDNKELIENIMKTRYEIAKLIGFNNYAQKSLATKMAKTEQEVLTFLQALAQKAKPFAERDFAELKTFASEEYDIEKLEAWDIAYYSEKLQQKRYAISDQILKPYFPAPQVLAGMFEVVRRLYGLKIVENTHVKTWHETVQFFEIFDENNHIRGKFYLDLFARNQKRGGAWMDEARVKRRLPNGELQIPVAYLTCNFSLPLNNEPSLLTHQEVLTLFHEFGHGLHHMLTQIEYADVSGINGVPWDAVEMPSQFMENWCWEKEALAFISAHYQTHLPLPNDLLEKMLKAKNFQAGMMLIRQLEFSLFDFRLHCEFNPALGARVDQILQELRSQWSVVPVPAYNRFANSFNHVFSGGYAAGYYSYLWAEVLAQDAFAKFEEEGIFNASTGREFLHKILEKGGSEDPQILFKNFRGRDYQMAPFLHHRGLTKI